MVSGSMERSASKPPEPALLGGRSDTFNNAVDLFAEFLCGQFGTHFQIASNVVLGAANHTGNFQQHVLRAFCDQ